MDCYIYAVEKSLDSYKFNLLQNKQVFINQLKSRNLAARTIDEGAIDENGGGNFSEYVAILSGNDDLLEKAKLDKKLAVLESERQAYHRNKGNAKGKLNEKTAGIEKNNIFIGRFTRDWEYLNKVAPVDAETGLRPNPLKLDGVDSDNIEILGNRLAAINQKAQTEDDYMKIGTLFDFRILVRTEKTCNGDTQALQNKFMVEGLDGLKYTYHNGYIAKDPKLAVMYFINALERIPGMIEKREKENAELSKDIPVLQEIVAATWPKEGEIKKLGEELATLSRKIQLTLKPVGRHENAEGKETACEMMLVTPALDFKNSESKIFTFRVRGDYLLDNQTDLLELCYIDLAEGDMFIAPVDGFSMPNMQDQSGEWQEFHIDLTGQNIADVFFMGFRFKSTRGRTNSVTYYIDDVSYGRTDLAVIRPSHKQLVFNATAGIDAISDEVTVTGNNLTEPIKLTLSGPNKSKFKLSTNQLPVTGGSFMVSFNSDEIGVHEAYVKLASRGAADIYVPISVNNTVAGSIEGISTEHSNIEVYDLNGRKVAEQKMTTAKKATKNLPAGIYVIKLTSDKGINFYKIKIK